MAIDKRGTDKKKRKGHGPMYWLGKKRPDHAKKMMGRGSPNWKGRTLPKKCLHCGKYFKPNRGEDKYCKKCWGSMEKEEKGMRYSPEYRAWRTAIFERDGYRCQICQQVGGSLEVHHIKPIRDFPEFILDSDNGVTVCIECHKLIDAYRV